MMSTRTAREFLEGLKLSEWKVPGELEGLALDSFDELKGLFSDNNILGEVYLREERGGRKHVYKSVLVVGFDWYSRRYKKLERGLVVKERKFVNVAYGCPECEKIVVGEPVKKEGGGVMMRLMGGREWEYHCRNCDEVLYNYSWVVGNSVRGAKG